MLEPLYSNLRQQTKSRSCCCMTKKQAEWFLLYSDSAALIEPNSVGIKKRGSGNGIC